MQLHSGMENENEFTADNQNITPPPSNETNGLTNNESNLDASYPENVFAGENILDDSQHALQNPFL